MIENARTHASLPAHPAALDTSEQPELPAEPDNEDLPIAAHSEIVAIIDGDLTVPETIPSLWSIACLSHAATRDGFGTVLLWLVEGCPNVGASFPFVWDGKPIAPVEPTPRQLAELIERVSHYENLPRTLAWTLINCRGARHLLDHLIGLMRDTGTWGTEGGALAAVFAEHELMMLVSDDSWQHPSELLNEETVPAGVSWPPILALCGARLRRANADDRERLSFVRKRLREIVDEDVA